MSTIEPTDPCEKVKFYADKILNDKPFGPFWESDSYIKTVLHIKMKAAKYLCDQKKQTNTNTQQKHS